MLKIIPQTEAQKKGQKTDKETSQDIFKHCVHPAHTQKLKHFPLKRGESSKPTAKTNSPKEPRGAYPSNLRESHSRQKTDQQGTKEVC